MNRRTNIRFVLVIPLFAACVFTIPVTAAKPSYQWSLVAPAGSGCFPPKCAQGKFPMAVLPVTGFDGKLFAIGDRRVWSSSDGVRWSSAPKTNWGERYGMRFAYFQNRLWMLGGMRSWDDFRNDVWSSPDGEQWSQVVENAPWPARRGHGVIAFKEKLWVLGGSLSSGRPDELPTRGLNDVWSSTDGIKWEKVTEHAPWSERECGNALVFAGRMWIIGGPGGNDIWSTADGREWRQESANAAFGTREGAAAVVFDAKIWVYGGARKNDVWQSANGVNWVRVFAESPWSKRSTTYSAVYKDKLMLFSGKTGRSDTQTGEIWAMTRKTE